jgi:hypothetical protein
MFTSGTLRGSIVVLAKIALTSLGGSAIGLAGLPGGLPVGTYLLGIAIPAARAGLEERAEPAVRAGIAKARLGNSAKAGSLAALVLNDVPGCGLGHVEQPGPGAPVDPASNFDLSAVGSLRYDLHLILVFRQLDLINQDRLIWSAKAHRNFAGLRLDQGSVH